MYDFQLTSAPRIRRVKPMSKHKTSAAKDFNRSTLAALAKRGIAINGATFVPGTDGSYAKKAKR